MSAEELVTISRADLGELPYVCMDEFKQLCSYSWIQDPRPTITIPGSPAHWDPPSDARLSVKGAPSPSSSTSEPRIGHYRRSCLEPLFRTLFSTQSSFEINSVHIVSDRSILARLFEFVDSDCCHRMEPFDVEIVNNTALFCEAADKLESNTPDHFPFYKASFTEACTSEQIERTAGSGHHNSILLYWLGGLRLIVRYEPDACTTATGLVRTSGIRPLVAAEKSNLRVIPTRDQATSPKSNLEIRALAQIHGMKQNPDKRCLASMWLSQTPNLVVGLHRKGRFQQNEVQDFTVPLKKWEKSNRPLLGKLALLLKGIVAAIKEKGCRNASVRYDRASDVLVVCKRDEKERLLPEDLYQKFKDGTRDAAESAPPAYWRN